MSNKPTVVSVNYTTTLALPRRCEYCGTEHTYRPHVCLTAGQSVSRTRTQQAFAELQLRLSSDPELSGTCGVLCPSCGRFASAALARHAPHGLRQMLVDRYLSSQPRRPHLGARLLGLLATFLLFAGALLGLLAWKSPRTLDLDLPPWPFAASMVLAGLASAVASSRVSKSAARRKREQRLREATDALACLDDERLATMVKVEYKLSRNNLLLPSLFGPSWPNVNVCDMFGQFHGFRLTISWAKDEDGYDATFVKRFPECVTEYVDQPHPREAQGAQSPSWDASRCWFCERAAAVEECAVPLVMLRDNVSPVLRTTVFVPRCRSCAAAHKGMDNFIKVTGTTTGIIGALCGLPLFLVGACIGLLVGGVIGGAVARMLATLQLKSRHIRTLEQHKQCPLCTTLLTQGYRFEKILEAGRHRAPEDAQAAESNGTPQKVREEPVGPSPEEERIRDLAAKAKARRTCPHCGTVAKTIGGRCKDCGTQIGQTTVPAKSQAIPAQPVPTVEGACPACGHKLPSRHRGHCMYCGASLPTPESTSAKS